MGYSLVVKRKYSRQLSFSFLEQYKLSSYTFIEICRKDGTFYTSVRALSPGKSRSDTFCINQSVFVRIRIVEERLMQTYSTFCQVRESRVYFYIKKEMIALLVSVKRRHFYSG